MPQTIELAEAVTAPPITMADINGMTEALRRVASLRVQEYGEGNRLGWEILRKVGHHITATIEEYGRDYFSDRS